MSPRIPKHDGTSTPNRRSEVSGQILSPADWGGTDYYAAQLAATPDDADRRRRRLILLRDQALLHVLYATAGRASEVAQLIRSNVAEGSQMQIQIVGKGDKRRPLLLTEPAQRAIKAYLEARRAACPG